MSTAESVTANAEKIPFILLAFLVALRIQHRQFQSKEGRRVLQ